MNIHLHLFELHTLNYNYSLIPIVAHFFGSSSYTYGFNGMEKDDEVKGSGNSYDFGARMHDPRLGRFFVIDPLYVNYPFQSPYVYASNNPISFIEVNGEGPGDPIAASIEKKKGLIIVLADGKKFRNKVHKMYMKTHGKNWLYYC